jgi:hypothetical protein
VTPFRSGPLPVGLDSGFVGTPPPWMGDEDFAAVLFYASRADPAMLPGGKAPNGGSSKILWLIRDSTGPLTIHGTELRKGATFTQEIDGGGSYPSIVDVPSSGCWSLKATLQDREAGSITLPVR